MMMLNNHIFLDQTVSLSMEGGNKWKSLLSSRKKNAYSHSIGLGN